ncbi:hypothetical protein [Embleya sp. AB8]|uniref:hypothetical protein n=1 Tax=Embleya sp. AB8 TaxID=3156304 RepID=UPI003C7108A2
MRINRVATALSAVVLGLVTVTACGGGGGGKGNSGDKKAKDVNGDKGPVQVTNADKDSLTLTNEAVAALQGEDFKLTGDMVQDASRADFDVCVHAGRELQGTMTIRDTKAEITVVGGKLYLRGDEAFWRKTGAWTKLTQAQIDKRAASFAGKQLMKTVDDNDPLESIGSIFGDPKQNTFDKGTTSEVDGKRVVALQAADSDQNTRTIYVLAEGKPYPVKVTHDGPNPVRLTLTPSKQSCTPVAPPADQTINLDDLVA